MKDLLEKYGYQEKRGDFIRGRRKIVTDGKIIIIYIQKGDHYLKVWDGRIKEMDWKGFEKRLELMEVVDKHN